MLPYRVGHGFDLHRLAEGYKLIIGGIEIPHTKGCEAHSDGGKSTCKLADMAWPCQRPSNTGPSSAASRSSRTQG